MKNRLAIIAPFLSAGLSMAAKYLWDFETSIEHIIESKWVDIAANADGQVSMENTIQPAYIHFAEVVRPYQSLVIVLIGIVACIGLAYSLSLLFKRSSK